MATGKLQLCANHEVRGSFPDDNNGPFHRRHYVRHWIHTPSPDIYLVVTSQMAGWMSSISQIGNWDIEKGEPVALRGNPDSPMVNYEWLNCRLAGYPEKLTCSGAEIDLERGLVNGAPVLAGWAHSQDGAVVRKRHSTMTATLTCRSSRQETESMCSRCTGSCLRAVSTSVLSWPDRTSAYQPPL